MAEGAYQKLPADGDAGPPASFCTNCGQKYTPGAQFCAGCGVRAVLPQATLVPGAQPTPQAVLAQPAGAVVMQPGAAVVVTEYAEPRPEVDHCAHCVLCLCFGGLWAPFWLAACGDMCCQYPCGEPGCT